MSGKRRRPLSVSLRAARGLLVAASVVALTTGAFARLESPHRVLVVPIDFPDLPGSMNPTQVQDIWVDNLEAFFPEVSNGQMAVEITLIPQVYRLPLRRWQYNHYGGISPVPAGICENLLGAPTGRTCENDRDCNDGLFFDLNSCRITSGFCDDRSTSCFSDADCASAMVGGPCRPQRGLCSNDLESMTPCTSRRDCGGAECQFFFGPWEFQEPLASVLTDHADLVVMGPNGLAPEATPDLAFHTLLFVDAIPDDCLLTSTEVRETERLFNLYGRMGGRRAIAIDPPADPDDRSTYHYYNRGFSSLASRNLFCTLEQQDHGVAAHELGHAIGRFAHPAGYISNYELMDSSLCSPGIFTRTTNAVWGEEYPMWFEGWVPDSKVAVYSPSTGGGTEILAPIEADPGSTVSPMGLKVELSDGTFYVVECRKNDFTNRTCWTDGVLIIRGAPPGEWDADDPDKVLNMTLNPSGAHERWQSYYVEGEFWFDLENDVKIDVGPTLVDGSCTVTVSYGPDSQVVSPDVGMLPWLSAPENTYETIDIWVDSSCNGYEDDAPSDPTRLKYRRRSDGTVIGNGDDPCLDHENRLYATVRNFGQTPANNVVVHFDVTDPLGVGIRGPDGWNEIGSVGSTEFPCLGSIPPAGSCDVYHAWTPSSADIAAEVAIPSGNSEVALHTCVRNRIDAVAAEVLLANQDGNREQENISTFELRLDPITLEYEIAQSNVFLHHEINPMREGARFHIEVDNTLPAGWHLRIGDDLEEYWMTAGQTRVLPVTIEAPPGAPIGQLFPVEVSVYEWAASQTPSMDPTDDETYLKPVSGLVLLVQTVIKTDLTLSAVAIPEHTCGAQGIQVDGCLSEPVAGVQVAIDYSGPTGTATQLATTDASGCFQDFFGNPGTGDWAVRALWQGDLSHASTRSVAVDVPTYDPDDGDCDQVPDAVDNCPDVGNPQQTDTDNDGAGDDCDCDPDDGGAFAIPPEVTNLRFLDSTTMLWDSVTSQSGVGGVSQVLTGTHTLPAPVGSGTADECVEAFVQGTSFEILENPLPGEIDWYRVRARNNCGLGTLGIRPKGGERIDPTCLSCSHDRCTQGELLDPACDACVGSICDADPYCCDTEWDSICIAEVFSVCGILECPGTAGSCAHSPCDTGTPLAEQCDNPPVAPSCVSRICGEDPWCCTNEWDYKCVDRVAGDCGLGCP